MQRDHQDNDSDVDMGFNSLSRERSPTKNQTLINSAVSIKQTLIRIDEIKNQAKTA